jgi:hypothetical protein
MQGFLLGTSGLLLLIGLVALVEGSTHMIAHAMHRRRGA